MKEMTTHHTIFDYFEKVYALDNSRADSKIARGKVLMRAIEREQRPARKLNYSSRIEGDAKHSK